MTPHNPAKDCLSTADRETQGEQVQTPPSPSEHRLHDTHVLPMFDILSLGITASTSQGRPSLVPSASAARCDWHLRQEVH